MIIIALIQFVLGIGLLHMYLSLSKLYKVEQKKSQDLTKDKRVLLIEYKQLDFKYAAVSNRLEELKRHKEKLIQELDRVKKKIKKR